MTNLGLYGTIQPNISYKTYWLPTGGAYQANHLFTGLPYTVQYVITTLHRLLIWSLVCGALAPPTHLLVAT